VVFVFVFLNLCIDGEERYCYNTCTLKKQINKREGKIKAKKRK
jgi:hypothetical protein